ncbi:unnamed protein product [Tuber aestivum]|uniref:Vacuolar protein sorting-associated protein 17 n=1 Tax=Tuber aestivum TaxID=59557 RepID=A0A292PLI0_9PEZI|nr:unnamed protein product [Tuber aestivum]
MDYSSGFGSEPGLFGDPTEQPFAQHRPPQTRSESSTTLISDDPIESPGFATPYSPHIRQSTSDDLDHPGFASQTPITPGFQDDDGGFRSPGLVGDDSPVESPKTPAHPDQQQQHQQEQQGGEHNQRPEAQGQGNLRGQQQGRVPQYKLQAKILALERTGRKDPILRFDVHTNLPKFRTTQFRDVRRTHPEFQKLANHLLSSNPECFVPAVPPQSTSAGVGTDEDETRVRATMQRWLNTVCSNDVLMRDEEMVFFVESDFGYSPVIRRKQPATGVRRRVIKQFAPPPDDTPELETARPVVKAFYLGTMETGQKVDRMVKSRRGTSQLLPIATDARVGLAESDFGARLLAISQSEAHQGMANAFRKLGKIIQSVGDFHAAQATSEATTLGDPLTYHSADAFIVKETLTNRQILMRELESARKDTRSKFQTMELLKGKSAIKRDRVDEALAALEEAKSNETHLGQKVKRVTDNLVRERRKWFARTSKDLRNSIRDYCSRQIEAERRTLATLESVRPDVRAIDQSGGLSRLGRDAPPASRRASLATSQGPRGDAWSGVQRVSGVNRGVEILNGGAAITTPVPGSIKEEEEGMGDEDRLDAKNAASRLAGSTF